VREIEQGKVFSRVAGVALGDHYTASIRHDLDQSALHVPLTSTHKHHFGTREIQINPLRTRMIDSAVNNVGTYGVRYDIDLNLSGAGPHELVLSHPVASGRPPFTAFRGSIRIELEEGYREVHVGLRSGQSLPISELNLKSGQNNLVKVSLVYPADATPGHLLSVVPVQQLAMMQRREQLQKAAEQEMATNQERQITPNASPPPPLVKTQPTPTLQPPQREAPPVRPTGLQLSPQQRSTIATPRRGSSSMPAAMIMPNRLTPSLEQRYRDAIRVQQEWLRRMQGR
jgi:hypothetical protein